MLRKNPVSLLTRLAFASLAGVLFLAALFVQGWLSDRADRFQAQRQLVADKLQVAADKLQAQERLTADLQRQVSLLHEEREELETEHERQLAVSYEWLGKVAAPRETILQTARLDASEGSQSTLEKCFAVATLERDGWNVTCRFDLCLVEPMIIHYIIDPLTGKILSKRVVRESDRKP